jgi:hypothetical protein
VEGTEIAPRELAAMESARLSDSERLALREYWDQMIEECRAEVAQAPEPTSALVDGSAAERRRRRMERRAVAAIVRELPVRRGNAVGPDGQAA